MKSVVKKSQNLAKFLGRQVNLRTSKGQVALFLLDLSAVQHHSRQTATPRLPFVFLCIASSTDPSVLRSFSGFQCL